MFDVTCLGHQGRLVEAGGTSLLVDPVLTDRITGQPGERLGMYPPRRIDLARLPPIDGIFCTHEHPDHLDLPTLLRLDRRARVFLPGTSSIAASAIVTELGYRTTLLRSGTPVQRGALELHPSTAWS